MNTDERIDLLLRENLKIIQSASVFSFSVDALLLADFSKVKHKDKIIDLCSGNGVIPLLLTHKTRAHIDAVEIQPTLIDMANRSIAINKLQSRITMHEADMKNIKQYFSHSTYDAITVNPPYFKNNQPVKKKEKHRLARHEIYINLEGVVECSRYLIKNRGRVYMVHRAERSAEIMHVFMSRGFNIKRIRYVYNDPSKHEAMFVLVEAVFNSNAYTKVTSPMYIYNTDGKYSDEMMAIYYG